jgi:superfamily II DNA or RNA helicase
MRLNDLIADGRTSISASTKRLVDRAGFRRDMGQLGRYGFWAKVRANPHLWDHQKAAIGTVVVYLNAERAIPERPEHQEAALLKLPTGTGKSGIIAVVARCLPTVRKVLVLTPREALTKQLLKDIRYRFWGHIGYEVSDGQLFTATTESFGSDLETVYTETFLPSHCTAMLAHLEETDRAVLVGTHQALDKIRRTALGDGGICAQLLDRIKETFDLVIVDEGHYEPAVSWSRGVRDFNLPTVLLSATPYRNDYKSFRVRGRFLFNYPHADAVRDRIVRPVEVIVPDDNQAEDAEDAVSRFVTLLRSELPARLESTGRWFKDEDTLPKVMVRADDLDTLEALQAAINAAFGTKSVLIHDRAKKNDQNHDRFTAVSSAISTRPDAQFWIHQYKLMEGIDDPSFVAIAIFDLMGNARQLVQQIGRATRYSNGDGRIRQTGWVIASPANARRIRTSWERYAAYEAYAADNVAFIVSNEVTLPDRLLSHMAEYQYISGEFRSRFEFETPLAAADIQLPQSAAVLRTPEPLANISALGSLIEEAILDEDRFKITPIGGMPADTMGFSYYAWRNSPLLIDRFFSEWKLGIFIAARQDEFVFMHDTEGLVVDMAKLGLKRADRALLEKAFPERQEGTTTRLSRLSFSSLEMSQQAIRSMAVRTRSFEEVFTDLLDPSLVAATVFGFVNGTARYVGFVRSRIRDAAERYVPVQQYLDWTAQVAAELRDEERKRSGVFGRYAQVVEGLTDAEATPGSILLDFTKDGFADTQDDDAAAARGTGNPEVDYDDLCADVDQETGEFTIKIGGSDIPCSIEYRGDAGKYRLKSEALNDRFRPETTDNRRQPQTLLQRLNQDQSFRIIVQKNGVVYSEGRFYEPRLLWKGEEGTKPILDYVFTSGSLEHVTSEKGEQLYAGNRDGWYRASIFGLFSAVGEQQLEAAGIIADELTHAIACYPIWLCDDDNREITDFIGFDEDAKKIVFAHAKMGKQDEGGTGFNVTSLQEVGRQALASLAFISRGVSSPIWTAERWQSDVQANTVLLTGRNRIFKNGPGLTAEQLNERLIRACQNPSFSKEIWIIAAKMVRRDALSQGLDAAAPGNRLRQLLMHWDALQTGCARASVRLRLFCD